MPYDPLAPTTESRSNIYKYSWFALASNILLLIEYFLPVTLFTFGILNAICFGGVIGGLLIAAMSGNVDDYFQTLVLRAFKYPLIILIGWLIIQYGVDISDQEAALDAIVVNGRMNSDGIVLSLPALIDDAYLLVMSATFAFFAGLAGASIKDSL